MDTVSKDRDTLFHYDEFGETGLKFIVRAWVTDLLQPRYLETQHQIIVAIKKTFDENNIRIPLGLRTIKLDPTVGDKVDKVIGENS